MTASLKPDTKQKCVLGDYCIYDDCPHTPEQISLIKCRIHTSEDHGYECGYKYVQYESDPPIEYLGCPKPPRSYTAKRGAYYTRKHLIKPRSDMINRSKFHYDTFPQEMTIRYNSGIHEIEKTYRGRELRAIFKPMSKIDSKLIDEDEIHRSITKQLYPDVGADDWLEFMFQLKPYEKDMKLEEGEFVGIFRGKATGDKIDIIEDYHCRLDTRYEAAPGIKSDKAWVFPRWPSEKEVASLLMDPEIIDFEFGIPHGLEYMEYDYHEGFEDWKRAPGRRR